MLLLLLVGRHPLEPAQRADHRQQQVQLGVLRHLGLHEQRRGAGADTRRQPVHGHVHDMLGNQTGIGVLGRQRMPVDDAEVAIVLVLQLTQFFSTPW
jgi:hypothetical protein